MEWRLGPRYLYGPSGGAALFTDNETNAPRVFGRSAQSRSPYVKDAFHRYLIDGDRTPSTPADRHQGLFRVQAARSRRREQVLPLRLSPSRSRNPLGAVDRIVAERKKEADEFYETVHPPRACEEER